MIPNDVTEKFDFTRRRLADLHSLIERKALRSEPHERQQLLQEFFFHLIGAIDLVAQLVNERRRLGLDSEDVDVLAIIRRLSGTDPLTTALRSLHVKIRGEPLPSDPYK